MSYELANKVKNLQPYSPISGQYPIRLDANESFLKPDAALLAKFKQALDTTTFNRYPDPYAQDVCAAFARFYDVEPQMVTAGNGSDELISIIAGGLLQKNATLISFEHDFSMYRFYGNIYELSSLVLPKNDDLQIDFAALIQTATEQAAQAIIFSNPCNPTSLGEKREDIIALLKALPNTLIIVDEAYMEFYDQSVLDLAPKYDNLIVLKTCSKAIGMAALRLGFAVCGTALTNALRAVKSPYNVNAVTQALGCTILTQQDLLRSYSMQIIASRTQLMHGIEQLAKNTSDIQKIYASCTNFVFLQVKNAKQVAHSLAQSGIIVRQMDTYLRITAGSFDENTALLDALKLILQP